MRATVITTVLAAVGATVGTWYLVGDLTTVPAADRPDRMVVLPEIPPVVEHGAGVLALGVLLGCLVAVARGVSAWLSVALVVVAGLLLGFTGRVVTAGVIGANIGGGIAVMVLVPVAAVLVLAAAVTVGLAARRERATDPG
ncbi:hypothetical protein WIS52_01660 [Pseudonocardia nematodicida]|uniref:Uncharacterized protein n=1 Tax=Pseudonocardia nematodicida TaxID=1206997 RepID=A0ABV1K5Q7_9PSEU